MNSPSDAPESHVLAEDKAGQRKVMGRDGEKGSVTLEKNGFGEVLAVFLLLLLVLVGLLLYALYTNSGTSFLFQNRIADFDENVPGGVSLGGVDGNLTEPLELHDLQLENRSGQALLELQTLGLDVDALGVMDGRLKADVLFRGARFFIAETEERSLAEQWKDLRPLPDPKEKNKRPKATSSKALELDINVVVDDVAVIEEVGEAAEPLLSNFGFALSMKGNMKQPEIRLDNLHADVNVRPLSGESMALELRESGFDARYNNGLFELPWFALRWNVLELEVNHLEVNMLENRMKAELLVEGKGPEIEQTLQALAYKPAQTIPDFKATLEIHGEINAPQLALTLDVGNKAPASKAKAGGTLRLTSDWTLWPMFVWDKHPIPVQKGGGKLHWVGQGAFLQQWLPGFPQGTSDLELQWSLQGSQVPSETESGQRQGFELKVSCESCQLQPIRWLSDTEGSLPAWMHHVVQRPNEMWFETSAEKSQSVLIHLQWSGGEPPQATAEAGGGEAMSGMKAEPATEEAKP